MRIEDVDTPRTQPDAERAILDTLRAYGFDWDGPVTRQSERTDLYRAALDRLIAQDDVFPCTCTRRELAELPAGASGESIYPGTCRHRTPASARTLPRHAWRLRVEGVPEILFTDRLQGAQRERLERDVGDFVVQRSDELFAYQLAVVVDDGEQGITDVVRGADLLTSTARQIHLQHRLGLSTPRYLHLPVAINRSGEKLSKQTRALPLPAHALPALMEAWRFLDQPDPPARPPSVAAFWAWAVEHWSPRRLPPVRMLAAPRSAG